MATCFALLADSVAWLIVILTSSVFVLGTVVSVLESIESSFTIYFGFSSPFMKLWSLTVLEED